MHIIILSWCMISWYFEYYKRYKHILYHGHYWRCVWGSLDCRRSRREKERPFPVYVISWPPRRWIVSGPQELLDLKGCDSCWGCMAFSGMSTETPCIFIGDKAKAKWPLWWPTRCTKNYHRSHMLPLLALRMLMTYHLRCAWYCLDRHLYLSHHRIIIPCARSP